MDKAAQLARVTADLEANGVTAELKESATQIVPGAGNPDAQIMFIGEAPGATEDRLGLPFVGAAGKFLDILLAEIDLARDDIFITSIVKYRPPANRDPLPQEIAESLPYLKCQIEIIEPKLIVFLGRYAMNAFFPELKIGQVHGQLILRDRQAYLPLYHPSVGRYTKLRQASISDFKLIPAIINKITINN
jgi:uracil-DNA glycosylase family 4